MIQIFDSVDIQDFNTTCGGRYIHIAVAGQGYCGRVWYAFPRTIHHIRKTAVDAELRNQIYAVKVIAKSDRSVNQEQTHKSFQSEVKVLKQLSNEKLPPAVQLPQLIDSLEMHDIGFKNSYWISMTAFRGYQLDTLEEVSEELKIPVPKELVAHTFLQLSNAVEFLQTRSNPIYKGDMGSGNALVDSTKLRSTGFPDFALIDFETSILHAGRAACSMEWIHLCDMMSNLATCDKVWTPEYGNMTESLIRYEFIGSLNRTLHGVCGANVHEWHTLLKQVRRMASKCREDVKPLALAHISRLVTVADEESSFPSDADVHEALRRETESYVES